MFGIIFSISVLKHNFTPYSSRMNTRRNNNYLLISPEYDEFSLVDELKMIRQKISIVNQKLIN